MKFIKATALATLLLPVSIWAAPTHALVSCLPEQMQGASSEAFDKHFPALMTSAVKAAGNGVISDAFFLDENYRNGAAFVISGRNAAETRARAEAFRDETLHILENARLPFKTRCTVGGKMTLK